MDHQKIISNFRRVVIIQLVIVTIVVLIIYFRQSEVLLASIYGGLIAITNSFLLIYPVFQARKNLKQSPEADVRNLYVAALVRFIFTLIAMAVGMSILELAVEPLLITFAVAQVTYMLMKPVQ